MKIANVSIHQYTDLLSYHLLYVSWMVSFAIVPIILSLLFINRFLQVWYQNEDIHYALIYFALYEYFCKKLTFYKCPGTFFAEWNCLSLVCSIIINSWWQKDQKTHSYYDHSYVVTFIPSLHSWTTSQ